MAPSLRNRKPSKPAEEGSDTDAGDDHLDEHSTAPATKAHSKGEGKLQKVLKRLFFGSLLLVTLCVIVASGHLATLALVQLVQIMMFRELVNVRYSARKFADVPLFRTMQWGWFFTCMLYSYGHAVNTNAKLYSLIASPTIARLLSYVEIVCMGLYSVLLVTTVLTLTKGYYRYQMGQLAWTMAICVFTVAQVTSFMANIFNGLFWFLFPVALVICNDSMAYFCGLAFGRKLIKRTFLLLSPNKTWEGFIGGGVCTVIFGCFLPVVLAHLKFLVCPAEWRAHKGESQGQAKRDRARGGAEGWGAQPPPLGLEPAGRTAQAPHCPNPNPNPNLQAAGTSHDLNDKFMTSAKFELTYGSLSLFYGGLESLIGPPNMVAPRAPLTYTLTLTLTKMVAPRAPNLYPYPNPNPNPNQSESRCFRHRPRPVRAA